MADSVYLALLRMFRWYSIHGPMEAGKWRAGQMVAALGRRIQGLREMEIVVGDGRRFLVDPRERQYLMDLLPNNVHEYAESRIVEACLEPGAVAVDIGANFGWFATLFSKLVGSSGAVHAFEPVPTTRVALERNLDANACSNVRVHPCALSDESGRATLRIAPNHPHGDASIYSGSESGVDFDCEVDTLDRRLLGELRRCDFLKCDVEGAETRTVRGARRTLERFRPLVLVEVNSAALARAGTTGAELLGEISALGGYTFHVVEEPGVLRRIDPATPPASPRGFWNVLCVPQHSAAEHQLAARVDFV